MSNRALPRFRVLRMVPEQCCARAPPMLRGGVFPAALGAGRANGPTTALGGRTGHDDDGPEEDAITARTAACAARFA